MKFAIFFHSILFATLSLFAAPNKAEPTAKQLNNSVLEPGAAVARIPEKISKKPRWLIIDCKGKQGGGELEVAIATKVGEKFQILSKIKQVWEGSDSNIGFGNIDRMTFKISPQDSAMAVRCTRGTNIVGRPEESQYEEVLFLVSIKADRPKILLATEVGSYSGNDENYKPDSLIITKNLTQKYYDLQIQRRDSKKTDLFKWHGSEYQKE